MEPYLIRFEVCMPYEIEKDGNANVSSCPPLDVFSQGDTEKEALENLVEAIQCFLESCLSRHVLDKVLSDLGFELAVSQEHNENNNLEDEHMINVPISLVAHGQAHAA